jgi:hypothetical protein
LPDNQKVKVTLRQGAAEVTAEGTINDLIAQLDSLASLVRDASEKLQEDDEIKEGGVSESQTSEEISAIDIPAIKPTKSTTDNLRLLFSTPWGKKQRTLGEIMKALEVNAVPDNTSNVNRYLTRLVQAGFLRRLQKEGKWAYFQIPQQ